MEKLSQSLEDYLEKVLMLHQSKGNARLKNIASELGVKAPSAARAMRELKELGLVEQEPYGLISLTPRGLSAAKSILGRHTLLRRFLSLLGVSEANADADACLIEYVLSKESLQCIENFVKSHVENGKSEKS